MAKEFHFQGEKGKEEEEGERKIFGSGFSRYFSRVINKMNNNKHLCSARRE